VAVGDPARLYPPTAVEEIRAGRCERRGFMPYAFDFAETGDRGQMMRESMARYTRALGAHRDDAVVDELERRDYQR
jgi:hypothetical protein